MPPDLEKKVKILRLTTVPISLRFLLRGQMRYMADRGFEVIAASADGPEISDVVEYENCQHFVFNLTRKITPFQDLVTLFRLAIWIRKQGFDIVHTHTPKAGLIGMLAARLAGVKIRLHTISGLPWMESTGLKRKLLKNVDRLAYNAAHFVYPNAHGLLDFAINERLAAKKKLKMIGGGSSNGIDMDYFFQEQVADTRKKLREDLGISNDSFVFCFIGRVVKDKGMNELAAAFKDIDNSVHLIIVGPYEKDLDPVAAETEAFFNNSSNVHLVGYQKDVRPFLKMSDALVFPTYREGLPNVPLQAGAMGLPCIVTDINGCNEIIIDHENGLIIPVKDVATLRNAMELLVKDEQLMMRLSANARKMIAERYGQGVIWEALYQEYISLIKKRLNV